MSNDSARVARFETIAAVVYEPLQRYLGRRAAPADAADVLSDTLTTVWRRLDSVPTDDPLPWCYGVARRCLANHRRGVHRRERLHGRLHVFGAAEQRAPSDPQDAIEQSDPDLATAMEQLSDSERDIVRLWAWERLEPREIAAALDLSPNAVSVALSRAKRKLADELSNRHEPGRQSSSDAGQVMGRRAADQERSGE